MRLLLVALVLLWTPAVFAAPEPTYVAVEVVLPSRTVYTHQSFEIALRVRVETAFNKHAVQLFRQTLDLPLELRVPWLDGVPGLTLEPVTPPDGASGRVVSLNGRAVTLVEASTSADAAVLELRRRVVATQPGSFSLGGTRVRFAYATSFEEDFLGGRVPLDRQDVTRTTPSLTLTVAAIPEQDRPASFVDAVGDFHVEAAISRTELDVDERTTFELQIEGQGNTATLTLPSLQGVSGLHVFGVESSMDGERRTLKYDIAITDAARTVVPQIPFSFFNPGPPTGYVTTRTQAIPLTIHGGAPTPSVPVASTATLLDEPPRVPYVWFGIGILLAVAVTVLLLLSAAVPIRDVVDDADAARQDVAIRDPARIDAARAAVLSTHTSADASLGHELAELVGAYLGRPSAAAIDPRLADTLTKMGVSADMARETADAMERLVAARYGGAPVAAVDSACLDRVVRALAETKRPPSTSP